MDYGNLLTKAWNTIWNNKFLIALGIIIVVLSGGGGGNSFQSNSGGGAARPSPTPGPGGSQPLPNFGGAQMAQALRQVAPLLATMIGIFIVILCAAIVVYILVWALRRIVEGGQIASVNAIEIAVPTGFSQALRAGWKRGWSLVFIGLIAGIPNVVILLILLGLMINFLTSGGAKVLADALQSNDARRFTEMFNVYQGLFVALATLCCLLIIIGWITSAFRAFADRACMIEEKGVIASYQRGLQVLWDNFGQVLLLLLIQIGIGIAIGVVLFFPALFFALCFFPVLWVINGTQQAYFSTLWTLAWREWTGGSTPKGEPVSPAPAPAV